MSPLHHTPVAAGPGLETLVDPSLVAGQESDCVYVVGFVLICEPYPGATGRDYRLASRTADNPQAFAETLAVFTGDAAAYVSYAGSMAEPALVTKPGQALVAVFNQPAQLTGFIAYCLGPLP